MSLSSCYAAASNDKQCEKTVHESDVTRLSSLCLASAAQNSIDQPRTIYRAHLVCGLDAPTMHQIQAALAVNPWLASWLKLHFSRVTHLREKPPLRQDQQGLSRVGEIWVKAAGIWSKRPLDAFWTPDSVPLVFQPNTESLGDRKGTESPAPTCTYLLRSHSTAALAATSSFAILIACM